ncbi:nucleotidyltransferase family protein [Maribacter sp. CXY002]|uniref:nucleotidyltransferase family protein n=1 Tax=Maribacter luteocoastalis TaxID=3407671 RepID=UPI003B66B23F
MNIKNKIAIVIVAAGSASRMGQIKQLLPWKGSSLLEHAITTLLKVQNQDIVLVLGSKAHEILDKTDLTKIETVVNQKWEKGIGSSIAYGIQHLLNKKNQYEGVLVCLADQPLLSTAYYQSLIEDFKVDTAQIIATNYEKGPGVPAVFPNSLFIELSLLDEDYGAKHILRSNKVPLKLKNAGTQIADIDTIEDYKTLCQQTKE